MPEAHTCLQCGAELPLDAPKGLCPKCLLSAAFDSAAAVLPEPTAGQKTDPPPSAESALKTEPHELIGRYKLLQKLGEGGCGIVYMAEQQEPVKRRVALKIIKLGMDTRQVIARFEAERQALALMDHPNIAKVLDGGATESGRPYFVMELVKGVPITRYCDENRLDTGKRLDLFIQVCQAVQHAHQKGIIHRDIKPSNILVADHDGVPVPKVIDFGIAKATTGQTLTDKTLFTAFEQFIGTPAYMSPEQAKLSGLDIDTRSDIYSLGVLLYELLTGKTPFDAKRLVQAGFEEICRIIREEEPPRPSTKLSTLELNERTAVADQRHSDPPKLAGLLRGDLDWIVMKTLEKDRNRRYETANGLAMDLQRFLNEEPVGARPPTQLYRFRKLVRRNKLVFAAGGAVLLALVFGLGVATWLFVRERAALKQAGIEGNKSKEVAQFLKDMLEGVGPAVAKGRDTRMLREILDKTVERVSTELTNQMEVQADLFTTIAEVYRALNQYDQAAKLHRQALDLRTRLFGEVNSDVAMSMDALGTILLEDSKVAEAEPLYRKALEIREKVHGEEHPEVAESISNLGFLFQAQGNLAEGERWCRRALAMRRKLLASDDSQVADSLLGVSTALYRQHKNFPEAEAMDVEALAIKKKHFGELHPDVARCMNNLAMVYLDAGKEAEGEAMLRDTIELWNRIMGEDSVPEAQGLNNLGLQLWKQGKLEDAEKLVNRALEIRRRVLGEKHDEVAESLNTLAVILQREGKLEEAEKTQLEHLALTKDLHGDKHPSVVMSKNNLAWVLRSKHKLQEAEDLTLEAVTLHLELAGTTNSDMAQMLSNVGTLRADQGKLEEAEKAFKEAVAAYTMSVGSNDLRVAGAKALWAHALCTAGKSKEAEPLARDAVELFRAKKPDRWAAYNAEAILGRSLASQTNYSEAEPFLVSGCTGMMDRLTTIPVEHRVFLKQGIRSLIQVYKVTDRPEEVAGWEEKLASLEQLAEPTQKP
jgi:tetratricopeptide (TPR) repeat protein/tRNA A-37 threonylcarbamoyl transferase component Bud32